MGSTDVTEIVMTSPWPRPRPTAMALLKFSIVLIVSEEIFPKSCAFWSFDAASSGDGAGAGLEKKARMGAKMLTAPAPLKAEPPNSGSRVSCIFSTTRRRRVVDLMIIIWFSTTC